MAGRAPDATELRETATELREGAGDAATAEARRPLAPGTLIADDYRIMKVLGREDLAISYMAEDVNLGVAVLLKEFAAGLGGESTAAARARFLREAQTLVRFRHPNIARAHRVFEANDTSYIVLDYEAGARFDTWLAGLGRAPTQAELDRIAGPLLGAVAGVHAAGYVHGDICPANVLVRENGSPVLSGFARAWSQDRAPEAVRSSDPEFAAPELRQNEIARCGTSSDIYAVAALFYFAVTGSAPAASERAPASGTEGDYRPEFLAAIDLALADAPEDRPQSIGNWSGIAPPPAQEPAPLSAAAAAPTIIRDPATHSEQKTLLRPTTAHGATRVGALSQLATRVISVLPEIKEETDIPQNDFESWLLPAAFVASALGALLFATGANFALAAVCQVAATALFFLRGYLPVSRFLSHTTRAPDAILRRVEQSTRTAVWMIAAILILMTVNPAFVERFITSNTQVPLAMLAVVIGVPAFIMTVCGFFGTPARGTVASYAVGTANILVLIFNVLLFIGFVFTILSTPPNGVIHPAVQVNRYFYVVATLACATLGLLVFVARLAAKQRLKQAALGY